ncbi:MAG: GNAT family N-acetyltransferase [Ruaniaceae bacterium]|nr:GNAT family N-acetyltransferase [Ruaniaceae bacterium]
MIEYRSAASGADMERARAIRFEVFVGEQHVPIEEEIDAFDDAPTTLHSLAQVDGSCVGTGRVLLDSPGHVHIGRLAVLKAMRGLGIGVGLMNHLENCALEVHGESGAAMRRITIVLSAQEYAMDFYRKLGYAPVTGQRYLDAGIWHQDMTKTVRV